MNKQDKQLINKINIITDAVEKSKQKAIVKIVKRLNKMSALDIQELKRLFKA